jgi:hypothetical protein
MPNAAARVCVCGGGGGGGGGPRRGGGGGRRRDEDGGWPHWKESESEETFLHEHTTDSAAASRQRPPLPLQPEPGGALLQVNSAIDLLHCFVHMHGWLVGWFGLVALHGRHVQFSSVQFHHEGSNGGMEWRRMRTSR